MKNKKVSVTKKLRCKKGVTLVEMMCVVVVLVLLTGLMAMGVNLAIRIYDSSMTEAEARILASTLTTAITDELINATSIQPDGTYYSNAYGHGKNTRIDTDEGGYVMLTGNSEPDMYILSTKAYTHNCTAAVDVKYDTGTKLFAVNLKIFDIYGKTLIDSHFKVKPFVM